MQKLTKLLLTAIIIGLLIAVAILARVFYLAYSELPLTSEKELLIPSGASVWQIVHDMDKKGIVDHPKWFTLYIRMRGELSQIKAGYYVLKPPLTAKQLADKLVSGDVSLLRFTIVEGWTYQELAHALSHQKGLKHNLAALKPGQVITALGYPEHSPEGMFYPDTYFYEWGTRDLDLLKQAYQHMQTLLAQVWQNRAPALPYKNPYQALIIASLIEKETAYVPEMPKIAGVMLRRLQIHMPLQIDASVIYGLGKSYDGDLTRKDLRKPSPYNTYLNYGLPPTPIAFPGKAAIEAALNPEISDDLYYVAKGDGTHVFSRTLKQHDAAIRKYLLPAQKQAEQAKTQRN